MALIFRSVQVGNPEIERLLEGREYGKRIGYPISLHTFRLRGGSGDASCTVTTPEGKSIEGVVHDGSRGSNRRTSAPGMLVFYPLEPLPKGAELTVRWTLGDSRDGRPTQWKFTATK